MYQDLIVVIVDKYLSEDVMGFAKSAGARGGTILHGRSIDLKSLKKVFNLSIEPEKEVVLILSKEEDTDSIIKFIDEGLKKSFNHQGIILVLDVLSALGWGDFNERTFNSSNRR